MQAPINARLTRTRKTKAVANQKPLVMEGWMLESTRSWKAVHYVLREAAKGTYPKPRWRVLMFPDASDLFWGSCVTKVNEEIYAEGDPVEQMRHETLGVFSKAFRPCH